MKGMEPTGDEGTWRKGNGNAQKLASQSWKSLFTWILLGTIWTTNSCKMFRLFLKNITAVSYTHEPALAAQYHLIDDHVLFMPVGLRIIFPQRVPNCKFFYHHLSIPSSVLRTPEQTPETNNILASFASGDWSPLSVYAVLGFDFGRLAGNNLWAGFPGFMFTLCLTENMLKCGSMHCVCVLDVLVQSLDNLMILGI